jgi:hypothetical protein
MGRLISIVASRPASAPLPPAGTPPTDDEQAIIAVVQKLKATQNHNPDHTVARASSVPELAACLTNLQLAAEDVVQIIGHGSPGLLSLGRTWTHTYKGTEGTYCLDSDPYAYGLLDHTVPAGCTVSLIGCSVGEDRGDLPNDGPTLIFDLARLWSATVGGAVGYVGPEDFDVDGKFIDVPKGYAPGTTRLAVARDRAVSVGVAPEAAIVNTAPIQLPPIMAVVAMPALGRFEREAKITNIGERALRVLSKLSVVPLAKPPGFALPELVLAIEDGGRLEILANGTAMRATGTERNGYFRPTKPLAVRSVVRAMVTAALQ